MRVRRVGAIATVAGLLLVVLVVAVRSATGGSAPTSTEETVLVSGTREADGVPVTLDGDIYLPRRTPAPAVLLAHGYGGSKDTVATQARYLAGRGYVVLTYSARGFGRSDGRIHLDSPDYEIKDGQRMLDYLAGRSDVVEQDGSDDPNVAVVGASYGGGLALMLAGTDPRVDAIVPSITWNDLRQALFPQFATGGERAGAAEVTPIRGAGVFKKQWTALLLGASAAAGSEAGGSRSRSGTTSPPLSSDPTTRSLEVLTTACGRLALDLCYGYLQAATSGRPGTALLNLLAKSSPARVTSGIRVATLLIQGQTDSLFPLSEADANARAIAANGAPVQLVWQAGGHDGGLDESDRLGAITADFLDRTLRPGGAAVSLAGAGFRVTVPDAVISSSDSNPAPQLRSLARYPGLPGSGSGPGSGAAPLRTTSLPLQGDRQLAISPPGATPAALTSLPGAGDALSRLGSAGSAAGGSGLSASASSAGAGSAGGLSLGVLPGQAATFQTAPLATGITITGSPRVTVRITSTAANTTLFASVVDVGPDGQGTLPRQLVSPVYLGRLPAAGRDVTIALPAVVHDVPAGHRLRVVLGSTDQAYALPADARAYQIALAGDRALTVPQVPLTVDSTGSARRLWLGAGLLVLATLLTVLAFALYHRRVRRRTDVDVDEELVDVPLAIENLGKTYGDGYRAVSELTFRVERGQVLGLLGPNGAGKTTTLRMLMGLILPTEGDIRIFGHLVAPGAAVLSRLGSFIEGPGFLPHLSGRDNLELYWRATGRPAADSGMGVALEIAGLEEDVERKVRTYSHGMRQRLAIAQAMLGLPDLLVLDEPTNGLDPPQIREMREVLRRYAATGRTVVVSSHVLAEVEQTCSHVVVMLGGRLVAQGPVEQLIGAATSSVIEVNDPPRAGRIAGLVKGLQEVEVTDTGLVVRADQAARAQLVRALVLAGVDVDRVAPQRGLEETFLALVGES